jgi:uncharacterized Fe-S cluster-containing protein
MLLTYPQHCTVCQMQQRYEEFVAQPEQKKIKKDAKDLKMW